MTIPTPEEYTDGLHPADPDLLRAEEGIRAKGMPDISVSTGYGRLLTLLVRMSGARRVLEIGALGGYSGICLARGLGEGGRITSLELHEEYARTAKEHMTAAGYGGVIDYIVGDAVDSLARLAEAKERFDFFFIDADKGNYPLYLERAIELASPGAVIAADNTLLGGRVADPKREGPSVLAMRRFNEAIASDDRLMGTLLPAYDGLAVALVK